MYQTHTKKLHCNFCFVSRSLKFSSCKERWSAMDKEESITLWFSVIWGDWWSEKSSQRCILFLLPISGHDMHFKINFYWSIVALQCVSFHCTQRESALCILDFLPIEVTTVHCIGIICIFFPLNINQVISYDSLIYSYTILLSLCGDFAWLVCCFWWRWGFK